MSSVDQPLGPAAPRAPKFTFGFFFFAYFLTGGIILPFWPRWLEAQGLSAEQVGQVLAGALIGKVISGLFFGAMADKLGRRKAVILTVALILLAGILSLHFLTGYWNILIVWTIAGSLHTTLIPLADSLSLQAQRRGMIDYGRVRLWGSISFILVSLGVGAYLTGRSDDEILTLLSIAAALTVVAVLLLPDIVGQKGGKARTAFAETLRLPGFAPVILMFALLQSSHATLYGFGSLHWGNEGHSEFVIGFLWAEGVVVEVLLFALGGKLLLRLGIKGLALLAIFGGLVRWLLLGAFAELEVLLLVQILHAFTFAATHLAAVTYVATRVPDRLGSTAQSLYDTLAMGVIFAIAMWVSGILFAEIGGRAFWVMAGLSGLAGILFLVNRKHLPARNQAPQ